MNRDTATKGAAAEQRIQVVVQNLQKRPHLASDLVRRFDEADVLLAQEINLPSEDTSLFSSATHNISKRFGYGTAIYFADANTDSSVTDVRRVDSPHAEVGGFVRKRTTVANHRGVEFVSFHGFNGQPFKDVGKLVDHVEAVLSVLGRGAPAVFAGDFNTWSESHLDAIRVPLEREGFHLAASWPYPGRDFPLDHAFLADGVRLLDTSVYECEADHRGAVLHLSVPT